MRRPEPIRFSDILNAPQGAFGTWTQIASPELLDMLGTAHFDFTIIDAEHGSFGFETVEALIRGCRANGLAPLVRVPSIDAVWIGKCLDMGAAAIVVPGIASADDAQRAIAATRFAPQGTRGACPCVGAGDHYITDWPAFRMRQHADPGVIALVETQAGLDAIDAICACPGLRALLIGPFDLSVSLGFDGNYQAPVVRDAIETMITAAHRHALSVMMPVFSPETASARRQVDDWRGRGVRLFVVGTDKILISAQFTSYLAALND